MLLTRFLKKHSFLKPVIKRSEVKLVPREIQLAISHNFSFQLLKFLPHLSGIYYFAVLVLMPIFSYLTKSLPDGTRANDLPVSGDMRVTRSSES